MKSRGLIVEPVVPIGREGEVPGSIPAGDTAGLDRGRRRGVGAATPADGEGRARGGKMDTPVEEATVSTTISAAAVGVGAGEADEGGTGSARPTASDFAF